MTSTKTLTAVAAGAIALATAGVAAAQTPYNAVPYGQTQTQQPTTQDTLGAIVGALFGNGSSLDGQWLRGQRPLNNNRSQFETRLTASVRAGDLSSSAAANLRTEYDALVRQETSYASGGFSAQERADLNQRYLALTNRLDQGGDYGDARGQSVADGQREFNARVDAAVSARRLTRTQATRLRADYQALIQTEAGYLRDGRLTRQEQDDLDAQLDALDARVGDSASTGGGYQLDNRTRLANIETALSTGERNGSINRTEAADIRVELGDLTRLEAAYARTSPSRDDADYLSRRLGDLETRARVSTRR